MSETEYEQLLANVTTGHDKGRRVRFWGTPDDSSAARQAVWRTLLDADVDHLNTDDLEGLKQFLLENDPNLSTE